MIMFSICILFSRYNMNLRPINYSQATHASKRTPIFAIINTLGTQAFVDKIDTLLCNTSIDKILQKIFKMSGRSDPMWDN